MLFLLTSLRKKFLLRTQNPPKLCSATSTSKNLSNCFHKQTGFDEVLLNLFEASESRLRSLFKVDTLHLKIDLQDTSSRTIFCYRRFIEGYLAPYQISLI